MIAPCLCYHQRPRGNPWSGLPPEAMLKSEHCAELVLPLSGHHIGESCLGCIGELDLVARVQESWPCPPSGGGCGRNAPPHLLREGESYTTWDRGWCWDGDDTPLLGSTEMALVAGLQCQRRASPTPVLPCIRQVSWPHPLMAKHSEDWCLT